jgi:hypothetical protein
MRILNKENFPQKVQNRDPFDQQKPAKLPAIFYFPYGLINPHLFAIGLDDLMTVNSHQYLLPGSAKGLLMVG